MQQPTKGRAIAWIERGQSLLQRLIAALFWAGEDAPHRIFWWAWAAALLLAGVYLWGIFFSWGSFSLDFLDWAEVTGPRYAVLKDAVTRGMIPLHTSNTTALRGVTDRYFSIADTPFSPQIFLLRFLPISRYIFTDVILFYTIGFLGLVLLARKYRLSPLSFLLLFLLFNFNGHVTGHFAVGHSIWTAYFLIPFFIYLALQLVEREQAGWRWQLGMAVLLVVILLQGYFHLYLWCLIFLALLALFNLRLVKPVLLAGIFGVLVALPRLLPPSLVLSRITQEYLGGFATVTEMIFNLFMMRDPDRAVGLPSKILPLNWWEQDYFIGFIGFALLLVCGILLPLLNKRFRQEGYGRPAGQPAQTPARPVPLQILTVCGLFAAFSIGQVFAAIVKVVHIPPLTGERVTARMFSLPLAFVLVLAVIFFQRWLDERQAGERKLNNGVLLVFLGLTALLFHDLNQHLQAWRVRYLDGLVYLFPKVAFNPAQHQVAVRSDPIYTAMLVGGSVVALAALLFLAWMALRERKQS